MSVDTRDILLKAAEDVQQGVWCRSAWFAVPNADSTHRFYTDGQLFQGVLTLEEAEAFEAERCAEGSIALATLLLGGTQEDSDTAIGAVAGHLPSCKGTGCPHDGEQSLHQQSLYHFNDAHLPAGDPFTAGQTLAELFRTTAESL